MYMYTHTYVTSDTQYLTHDDTATTSWSSCPSGLARACERNIRPTQASLRIPLTPDLVVRGLAD